MTPAERWAAGLHRAMTKRDVKPFTLARGIGVSPSSVTAWARGEKVPMHQAVIRAAEYLHAPRLVSLSLELRTKRCPVDDVAFYDLGKWRRGIYCSTRCARTANQRANRQRTSERDALAAKRLRRHIEAVAAMCAACEPEGLCRMAACELRPVSPLRMAGERVRVA